MRSPLKSLFYLFLSIALKNHDNPTIRNTSELICPNIYNVNVKAFDW
ncbi:prenyl cysteine carboxyl, partial [Colletotrichum scovillei]